MLYMYEMGLSCAHGVRGQIPLCLLACAIYRWLTVFETRDGMGRYGSLRILSQARRRLVCGGSKASAGCAFVVHCPDLRLRSCLSYRPWSWMLQGLRLQEALLDRADKVQITFRFYG